MSRKMLIDSDTASDDAVAILMAAQNKEIELLGVTIVSGNVPVKIGVKNALYTLEIAKSDVPVFMGLEKPFIQPKKHAFWYHGSDGMGEKNYPLPKKKCRKEHAVETIISLAKEHKHEIELVTLGPLTNLAAALIKAPEIGQMFKRVVMMAGSSGFIGNVTPTAEYNVWCDPEAAAIVFGSKINMEMVGWEVALNEAILFQKDIDKILNLSTPLSKFAIECNIHALRASSDWLGESGLIQNDPVAMAIAIAPDLSEKSGRYKVDVELNGKLTRGMTVVDERNVVGTVPGFTDEWRIRKNNILVHHKINSLGWKNLLLKSLSK